MIFSRTFGTLVAKGIFDRMLRNRIFLGVAPLVVLLMMVGGYAVWLFVRLGGAVNTTLHENYTSIVAMRDLKDAAVRIDRHVDAASGTDHAAHGARPPWSEQAAVCRRNVEAELAIITEPGETSAAEQLERLTRPFWRRPRPRCNGPTDGIRLAVR